MIFVPDLGSRNKRPPTIEKIKMAKPKMIPERFYVWTWKKELEKLEEPNWYLKRGWYQVYADNFHWIGGRKMRPKIIDTLAGVLTSQRQF